MSGAGSRGRSILLVSYFFPPTRDTGARRPAALAKYLARLGHRVTVLTTTAFAGGEEAGPPPGEIEVIRATDLQTLRARLGGAGRIDSLFDADTYSGKPHPLSYLVVPEPLRVAWAPFARRAAVRAHRERDFDAVITTSPPESAHLVGRALQRRGVPWLADVRDAWTFEPLRPRFPLALQRRADERLERRLLGAAHAVVCVSEPAAEDLRSRRIADPTVIANAWDPDDDPGPAAIEATAAMLDPGRFSLLYTGRFGSYGRDPRPLVAGMRALAADHPELAERLELAIAGPLRPEERSLLTADLGPIEVSLLGSLERERTLALQRHADALLLLAQPARSQLVNFKLFEYLAAERPILGLCAGTEAGRILGGPGDGPIAAADDPAAIAAALRDLLAGGAEPPPTELASRYRYPQAAEAVAAVLERAIGGSGDG
jgi:glycosyltransferase involved in cell wall biosynthesis